MIEVTVEKVEISFPKSPIIDIFYKSAPVAFEKSVITTDLRHLFEAISEKYGISACADIIYRAFNDVANEFDIKENKNETNSDT